MYNIESHIVHTAVDDDIGQCAGRFYIQVMHGFYGSQILFHYIVQIAPPLFHITDDSPQDTFICVCFHIDLNIDHVPDTGIGEQQDTFCQNDLFRLDVKNLVGTVVLGIIIDGTVNGMPGF